MNDPRPEPASGLRWTCGVIVTAAAVLLAINAASLETWTAQQPPEATPPWARSAIHAWWSATGALGLAAPREAISRTWKAAQAVPWPGQGTDPRQDQR